MDLLIQFKRVYSPLENVVRKFVFRRFVVVARLWRSLNVAQRCYATATILTLIVLFFDMQNSLTLIIIGGFVATAIVYEFWPRFMLVWDSLPGKAALLFVYAVIANFALASASGLVNNVTGVSAASLPYSHNFAIILMLPSWFFITTLLALVFAQLFMPFYLMVLLLIKPFGIHGLWHAPEYRFVFTTALVRYVWMIVVLSKVIEVSTESGILSFFGDSQSEEVTKLVDELKDINPDAEREPESDELPDTSIDSDQFRLYQKQMLAGFIFAFEADELSRCAHPEHSRVVELNDYEILTILPVKDNELGYTYTVLPCRSAAIGNSILP